MVNQECAHEWRKLGGLRDLFWLKSVTPLEIDCNDPTNHNDKCIDYLYGKRWSYKRPSPSQNDICNPVQLGQFDVHLNWRRSEYEYNARELKTGHLVMLRQNNYITHLVKVSNDIVKHENWTGRSELIIYKDVQVLWMIDWDRILDYPKLDDIFGYKISSSSKGLAIDLRTADGFHNHWNWYGIGNVPSNFRIRVREALETSLDARFNPGARYCRNCSALDRF